MAMYSMYSLMVCSKLWYVPLCGARHNCYRPIFLPLSGFRLGRKGEGFEKTILIIILTLCGAAVFADEPKKFALIIYNANYSRNRSLIWPLKDVSADVDK